MLPFLLTRLLLTYISTVGHVFVHVYTYCWSPFVNVYIYLLPVMFLFTYIHCCVPTVSHIFINAYTYCWSRICVLLVTFFCIQSYCWSRFYSRVYLLLHFVKIPTVGHVHLKTHYTLYPLLDMFSFTYMATVCHVFNSSIYLMLLTFCTSISTQDQFFYVNKPIVAHVSVLIYLLQIFF